MYCTKQDMIGRFGELELLQLTDRERTGEIDEAVLDQARGDAAAEIDGWLAARYELPLADLPPALVRVACELTRYHLHGDAVPERVQSGHANAVRFLRAMARGEAGLVREAGGRAETAGTAEFEPGRRVEFGGGF